MGLRDWLVPDEVQSAFSAASDMLSVVRHTSHFWLKHFVAAVLPMAAGAGVGYMLTQRSTVAPQYLQLLHLAPSIPDNGIKDVVTGILTAVSVLAGFMVTLMLFTGRTEGTRSLTVDQAPLYVSKVIYLLFSQALTLGVHLVCILLCIAWLVAAGSFVEPRLEQWLLILMMAVLSLAIFRALLLPFQIYEVHNFELQAMVAEKNAAYAAGIAKAEAERAARLASPSGG